jgi:hypothetical protein
VGEVHLAFHHGVHEAEEGGVAGGGHVLPEHPSTQTEAVARGFSSPPHAASPEASSLGGQVGLRGGILRGDGWGKTLLMWRE